jgi:hypothetical protein
MLAAKDGDLSVQVGKVVGNLESANCDLQGETKNVNDYVNSDEVKNAQSLFEQYDTDGFNELNAWMTFQNQFNNFDELKNGIQTVISAHRGKVEQIKISQTYPGCNSFDECVYEAVGSSPLCQVINLKQPGYHLQDAYCGKMWDTFKISDYTADYDYYYDGASENRAKVEEMATELGLRVAFHDTKLDKEVSNKISEARVAQTQRSMELKNWASENLGVEVDVPANKIATFTGTTAQINQVKDTLLNKAKEMKISMIFGLNE